MLKLAYDDEVWGFGLFGFETVFDGRGGSGGAKPLFSKWATKRPTPTFPPVSWPWTGAILFWRLTWLSIGCWMKDCWKSEREGVQSMLDEVSKLLLRAET